MLLPGVSGALVLLTLGLYDEIVGYVHNMDFVPLIYFFLGGFIALFTFVPFLNRMLNDHREFTMSILTGLMIGSLVTLWPWKESYDKGSLPVNLPLGQLLDEFNYISIFLAILAFVFGIFSSYGLKYFEYKLEN